MSSFIEWEHLNTLIASITPILLGIIGLIQVKRDRRSKREKALQAELDEQKAQEEQREKEALVASISSLGGRVEQIGTNVEAIADRVDSIAEDQTIQKQQLNRLSDITNVNLEYSRSLGNVIITMGSALRASDSVDSEKIDTVIEDFRQKEQEVLRRLYKAMY